MRVELWFDFSCPYAYLASTQIEALCARTGATLDARPMLLGGVFRARAVPQKLFTAISPAKARHNALDLERWARRFGVPYTMPAGHPFRTVEALRALLAVGAPFMPLAHAFFRAYWVEGRDLGERAVLVDVLTRAGHDAERVLAAAEAPAIKDELRARTDEAIARGIFGAPALFVGDELYWGQDRLDDVERALGGTPPAAEALRVDDVEAALYFDPACPHVAVALPRAAATYARLRYVPLSLDDLLRRHYPPEGVLPAASEAKQRYLARDLARRAPSLARGLAAGRAWPLPSERNGLGFLALAGQEAPWAMGALSAALVRATWVEGHDPDDPAVIMPLARAHDLEHLALRAAAGEGEDLLAAHLDEADRLDVCGVPALVVGPERQVYFGEDRLELALDLHRGRAGPELRR